MGSPPPLKNHDYLQSLCASEIYDDHHESALQKIADTHPNLTRRLDTFFPTRVSFGYGPRIVQDVTPQIDHGA